MKILITFFLTIFCLTFLCQTNSKHVYVKPYTKSDGTQVEGHYRTSPNSTNTDNFSTKGNTNSYTGEPGYVRPDNNALTYPSTTYPSTTYSTTSHPSYNSNESYNSKTSYNNFSFKYDRSSVYDGYPSYSTVNIANLRQEMSSLSAVVMSIPKGETVKVVNSSWGEWWEVYYNDQTGYIHKSSLSFYSAGKASPSLYSYDSYPTYVAKIKLNMRTEMSSSSAIETIISKDEQVKIINSSWGDWWEIYYDGYTGYVRGSFLLFFSPEIPSKALYRYDSYPLYKTKTTANLRQEMSPTSAIKIMISKDESVRVINSSWSNWWEVYYDGHTGYVYSSSLTK